MYSTSLDYKTEVRKANRSFAARITIGDKILTDEDIVSMDIIINQGSETYIGNTISKVLDLTFLNKDFVFLANDIVVEVGININGTMTYLPVGTYKADDVKSEKLTTTVTAYDSMYKTEIAYFSDHNGVSTSITTLMSEICSKCGLTFSGTLAAYNIAYNNDHTCREMIGYIASLVGGNAFITNDNKLTIKALNGGDSTAATADNYFSMSLDEEPYKIGKITCTTGENTSISKGSLGADSIELQFANPYVTDAIMTDIYNKLNGFNFLGYTCNWQGDLSIEPFDFINITDTENVVRKCIVLGQKLSYNGGITSEISAKGRSKNDSNYNPSMSATEKVKRFVSDLAFVKKALADVAYVRDLIADKIKFKTADGEEITVQKAIMGKAEVGDLKALRADIDEEFVNKLTADNLKFTYGTGGELTLQELLTSILSASDGHVLNLTSNNVVLANALIKDAMIDSVNASKINAGSINTGKVTIQSSDGNMKLTGSLLQFKDTNNNVRIQLGLDGNKVYSLKILDEKGNLQFDTDGATADGLHNGVITDDKVADDANISGKKIDIDSLITEINAGTTTLKASKIYLDTEKQTLETAFNTMSNTVSDTTKKTETNTTKIEQQQGQIDTLVKNTTITEDGKEVQLKDAYSALKQTVNEVNTKVTEVETDFTKMEISAINLIRYSKTFEQGKRANGYWTGDTWNKTVNSEGFTEIQISATGLTTNSLKSYYSNLITIKNYLNKDITFSFEMKVKSVNDWDDQRPFIFEYYDKNGVRIAYKDIALSSCTPTTLKDDTWTKITYKRKVDTNNMYWTTGKTIDDVYSFGIRLTLIKNGDVSYRKPCLLQTNVNSNYVEAPEDIEERNNANIGKTVASTVTEYYMSTSNTTQTGGSWSTDSPSWSSGKYIWSRNKTTLRNGTVEYSNPVCIQGAKGETGSTGKGIKSVTAEYYMSTSKTTQSGGTWVTSCPAWRQDHYLWTRNKITYTDNTTAYTNASVDSSWEAVNAIEIGGRNLALGTTSDYQDGNFNFDGTGINNCSKNMKTLADRLKLGDTLLVHAWLKYSDIVLIEGKTKANVLFHGSGDANSWNGGLVFNTREFNPGSGVLEYHGNTIITSHHLKNAYWYANFRVDNVKSGKIEIAKLKVEKGTKETDWSPAPEDTQSQIDSVVQRVTTAEQKITPTAIVNAINTALTDSSGNSKIDTVSTVLDKDGLTVKNGAFKIINTAGETVLDANKDNKGNLFINGEINATTNKNNICSTVKLNDNIPPVELEIWNHSAWEKDKAGRITGLDLSHTNADGLDVGHVSVFTDSGQPNYNYLFTNKPLLVSIGDINHVSDDWANVSPMRIEGSIEFSNPKKNTGQDNCIMCGSGDGAKIDDYGISGTYNMAISAWQGLAFGSTCQTKQYQIGFAPSAVLNTRSGKLYLENGMHLALADMGSKIQSPGYLKFNNGLIIQWGKTLITGLTADTFKTITVTFPISFPHSVLSIQFSVDSSFAECIAQGTDITSSNFGIAFKRKGSAYDTTVYWFAIGY